MATKKPKNLISNPSTYKKHYKKDGTWKLDKPSAEEYEDVGDYADQHPEYKFQATEHKPGEINPATGKPYKYTNSFVGIHDPKFGQSLGASFYANMTSGGGVVRIGERKIK